MNVAMVPILIILQVLDFGASRDGVPEDQRGRRILVNDSGQEIVDPHNSPADAQVTLE